MTDRNGIFAGDDPFDLARAWLAEAEAAEPNDPNAISLATVDADGLPDVRVVLLKGIEGAGGDGSFVFFTNYESAKASQIDATGVAAFVMHWKSLRRQIRVRGDVTRLEADQSDAYFASRALQSRIGAWSSPQSRPVESRDALMQAVAETKARFGDAPPRPPFWGGFRLRPRSLEFWADGAFRLHDRFRWTKLGFCEQTDEKWSKNSEEARNIWSVSRLGP